jgi:hypothetical protein
MYPAWGVGAAHALDIRPNCIHSLWALNVQLPAYWAMTPDTCELPWHQMARPPRACGRTTTLSWETRARAQHAWLRGRPRTRNIHSSGYRSSYGKQREGPSISPSVAAMQQQ